jgi:hypothetical protein
MKEGVVDERRRDLSYKNDGQLHGRKTAMEEDCIGRFAFRSHDLLREAEKPGEGEGESEGEDDSGVMRVVAMSEFIPCPAAHACQ